MHQLCVSKQATKRNEMKRITHKITLFHFIIKRNWKQEARNKKKTQKKRRAIMGTMVVSK